MNIEKRLNINDENKGIFPHEPIKINIGDQISKVWKHYSNTEYIWVIFIFI